MTSSSKILSNIHYRKDVHMFRSLKSIHSKTLVSTVVIALNALLILPAHANCNDRIGSLKVYQPAMKKVWENLQAQTDYPWGKTRVYSKLEQGNIYLTSAFDSFSGSQKMQVIDYLLRRNWTDLISQTREDLSPLEIGALPPYQFFTQDGRLVYTAYDGCTPLYLMTESARFSYYHNRRPEQNQQSVSPDALRNSGQPFWRTVRFSIAPNQELSTRLRFWQAIGYERAIQGWWIAWVPEQGVFEINVPTEQARSHLNQFWPVAPRQYKYIVVKTDGTQLLKR